jgi:endonuclease YncB( thermonuclease family)
MRRLAPLLLLTIAAAVLPAAVAEAKTGRCLLRSTGPKCHIETGRVTFIADGDTFYADVAGDGTRRGLPVRITGVNAMEQTTYTSRAANRRGECHAVEATARLEQLLRRGRMRVRLLAQDPASRSRLRLRRAVAVRYGGRWRDVGRILVSEGHGLWLPNRSEYAWNRDYSVLAGRAAAAQRNLWDPDYCGPGPSQDHPLKMWVNWDAEGDDTFDPNGEWIRLKNLDPVNSMPLGGWWLRDSALRKYVFPSWATVPPGGEITLYVGRGATNDSEFYWGRRYPAFENVTRNEQDMGDGAYLYDPEGDLRLATVYPCRENCTDPVQGSLRLAAKPTGREKVDITNVGGAPVDLEPYRLTSRPHGYSFAPGSVLNPGETMSVRLWESLDEDDSRLVRYWPTDGRILNDLADSVELRRYDDVTVACTDWGDYGC